LFIGSEDSGKSSIFQQFQLLNLVDEKDINDHKLKIARNIIEYFKELILQVKRNDNTVDSKLINESNHLLELDLNDQNLFNHLVERVDNLVKLWNDKAIQDAFEKRLDLGQMVIQKFTLLILPILAFKRKQKLRFNN